MFAQKHESQSQSMAELYAQYKAQPNDQLEDTSQYHSNQKLINPEKSMEQLVYREQTFGADIDVSGSESHLSLGKKKKKKKVKRNNLAGYATNNMTPNITNHPSMNPSEMRSTIHQDQIIVSKASDIYDFEDDNESHEVTESQTINTIKTKAKQFDTKGISQFKTFDQRGNAANGMGQVDFYNESLQELSELREVYGKHNESIDSNMTKNQLKDQTPIGTSINHSIDVRKLMGDMEEGMAIPSVIKRNLPWQIYYNSHSRW